MSLSSAYELASTPEFRGKVTISLARAARKLLEDDDKADAAKEILTNIQHYSERAFIIVAAADNVDSSASDDAIQKATDAALAAMVR
jgi:hypothetical protein